MYQKVKNVIYEKFFDGEISSNHSTDDEKEVDNGLKHKDSHSNHGFSPVPVNPLSYLQANSFSRPARERIMSETVDLNSYNRNRTFSIFDLLLNSRRSSINMANAHVNGPMTPEPHRENTDSSTLSSALIENLLTEYLISLPSSLEEFYKIMGEIYVAEILRQCPSIKSPTELMKRTLLGNFNSAESNQNNKSIINSLIHHILQLNTRQNRGLNPLESDIMRRLLVDNNRSKPTAFARTEAVPEGPIFQSLQVPRNYPSSEENKTHSVPPPKPQKSPKKSVHKQENKRAEQKMVSTPVSDSLPSSKDADAHRIIDHEPLMERAKRLLKKRASKYNTMASKRQRIDEAGHEIQQQVRRNLIKD